MGAGTSSVEEEKSINENLGTIESILFLKDGRLLCSFKKSTIKIYDVTKDYECVQTINDSSISPGGICQLDNGDLVFINHLTDLVISSLTPDGLIQEMKIHKPHHGDPYSYISTLSTLSDNRVATTGPDGKLKIWDMNKPYQEKKVFENTLYLRDPPTIDSMYYDRDREIVIISAISEDNLRVFDVKNYKELDSFYLRGFLVPLDKNRLLVGGIFRVDVIDLETFKTNNLIYNNQLGSITALIKLNNNFVLMENTEKKMFLSNLKDEKFLEISSKPKPKSKLFNLDLNKNNLSEISSKQNAHINNFMRVNDDTFLSSDLDGIIKIWKDEKFISQK